MLIFKYESKKALKESIRYEETSIFGEEYTKDKARFKRCPDVT